MNIANSPNISVAALKPSYSQRLTTLNTEHQIKLVIPSERKRDRGLKFIAEYSLATIYSKRLNS